MTYLQQTVELYRSDKDAAYQMYLNDSDGTCADRETFNRCMSAIIKRQDAENDPERIKAYNKMMADAG